MTPGDSGHEAYTAIAWGVGLSHERSDIAGAEGFHSLDGNMCGTAMRGADALPGSKAKSRAKGSYRNLGGLVSGRQALRERDGPHHATVMLVSVRNLLLKALDESQHGLPSKRLSGTSFDFVVWKNESNQPYVSGRTLGQSIYSLCR